MERVAAVDTLTVELARLPPPALLMSALRKQLDAQAIANQRRLSIIFSFQHSADSKVCDATIQTAIESATANRFSRVGIV